jgi:hypothetical protein
VHYDLPRIRRLATDAIGALSDEELTARVGAPLELAPALRGARDLNEAREFAAQILEPEPVTLPEDARPTIERFKELAGGEPRETIRELKAVGATSARCAGPHRPRPRPRALDGRRGAAARRGAEEDRCGSMTPPPGSCRSCRRRPARSGCTSAGRPSTSASTSATRDRS